VGLCTLRRTGIPSRPTIGLCASKRWHASRWAPATSRRSWTTGASAAMRWSAPTPDHYLPLMYVPAQHMPN